jgi:hypothetical protein
VIMGAAVAGGLLIADLSFPALAGSALSRLGVLLALVALGVLVYGAAIDRLGVAKIGRLLAAMRQSR